MTTTDFANIAKWVITIIVIAVVLWIKSKNSKDTRTNIYVSETPSTPAVVTTVVSETYDPYEYGDDYAEIDRLRQLLEAVNNKNIAIKARRVLRGGEVDVFYATRDLLNDYKYKNWHVSAQTCLGELFETEPKGDAEAKDAFFAFQSRRSDLVVTNNAGLPVLMIEYQGSKHGTGKYFLADEIKRRVFQRAKVRTIELPENLSKPEMKARIKEQLEGILASKIISTDVET